MPIGLGGDAFTRKYIIRPLALTSGQNLLHHVTYSPVKFEVATSNSLGEVYKKCQTYILPYERTDRQTDFGTKLIYFFFLKKKASKIKHSLMI